MRDALKVSERDAPGGRTRHAAGDLVICTSCAKPLYLLERGINLGDKAGSLVDAFAPVSPAALEALTQSRFADQGVVAFARALLASGKVLEFCDRIPRPKKGDPMLCAHCGHVWAQVLSSETADTLDRAYTIELVTIPLVGPAPAIKGRKVSARDAWVHA
jgi:hypothetical protein